MNTVDRILNFINSQDTENTEQPTEQPTNNEITEQAITVERKQVEPTNMANYKQTLRQLNKLNKQQDFPCIAKIDGKNKVINSSEELNNMLNEMKASHRLQLKEAKRQQIDNYKHFNEEYERNDEDFEDDGLIYKRGDIVAVKKADKVYKAPRTNKKDRQRIYNSIRGNKKLLTDLTLSKDEEQFKNISSDNLRNEELNIYHKHRDNTINKDSTWTRASFLSMMNKMINSSDDIEQPTRTQPARTQQTKQPTQAAPTLSIRQHYQTSQSSSYGLNPLLFGRQ